MSHRGHRTAKASTPVVGTEPLDPWRRHKPDFPWHIITNVLFSQDSGNQVIAEVTADAVSFAA